MRGAAPRGAALRGTATSRRRGGARSGARRARRLVPRSAESDGRRGGELPARTPHAPRRPRRTRRRPRPGAPPSRPASPARGGRLRARGRRVGIASATARLRCRARARLAPPPARAAPLMKHTASFSSSQAKPLPAVVSVAWQPLRPAPRPARKASSRACTDPCARARSRCHVSARARYTDAIQRRGRRERCARCCCDATRPGEGLRLVVHGLQVDDAAEGHVLAGAVQLELVAAQRGARRRRAAHVGTGAVVRGRVEGGKDRHSLDLRWG